MPRTLTLDKGSKRKLRGIRWTPAERISAVVLFLLLAAVCIFAALWVVYHDSDSVPEPTLEVSH